MRTAPRVGPPGAWVMMAVAAMSATAIAVFSASKSTRNLPEKSITGTRIMRLAVEGQTADVTERLRAVEMLIAALMREVAGISRPERLLAAAIARLLAVEQRVRVLERRRRGTRVSRRSRRPGGRGRPADRAN